MSTGITSSLKGIGAAIGVAFGTQQIIAFTKEAVQLASKAEGIRTAFAKLNKADLLDNLRKATRGTVDDIKLMQSAVKAQNFKVPLDKLAGFFKFATNRAIETGESVDYLVDSIINGIGRKSTLVLDNLGISATELQEEMKKTGDFGEAAANIIARELEKAGNVADTTAIKIAQINTALVNMKTTVGAELISQLSSLNDQISDVGDGLNKSDIDGAGVAMFFLSNAVEALLAPFTTLAWIAQKNVDLFNWLSGSVKDTEASYADFSDDAERATALFREQGEVMQVIIKNLAYYDALIIKLQTDQKDANITRAEVRRLEDEINEAIRQRLILLGKLREIGGQSFEPIEPKGISAVEKQKTETDDILADYEHRNGEILAGQKKLNAMLDAERELQKEQEREAIVGYLNLVSSTLSRISSLQQQLNANELRQLDEKLDRGQISRERYDAERKKLMRRQAEDEKALALVNAIVSTASAVAEALPNVALAALAGVLGAAEIAVIAATPIPQFAKGIIDLKGAGTGTSDSINAKLSRGESVMTAKETQIHKELFKSIRNNRYDDFIMDNHVAPVLKTIMDGGLGALGASYKLNSAFNDRNMLKALDRTRQSEKDSARFIVAELKQVLKPRKRGNYA